MKDEIYLHKDYLTEEYDDQFKTVGNLKWLPWIGKNYKRQERKIVILGESHYDWKEDLSLGKLELDEFTRYVVSDQGLSHINSTMNNRRIFRNIERLFSNSSSVNNLEREEIWSNVAYLNLVQRPMDSIDHRPTYEDYVSGWNCMKKIIKILEPHTIIVLGTEGKKVKAFEELTNEKVEYISKVGRSWRKRCKSIALSSNIEFIKHPSSYFSWSLWHQEIKTEIKK